MKFTNKQKRQMIVVIFLFFILLIIFLFIKGSKKEIDVTNSIHGIVNKDNTEFIYKKNKLEILSKGERVYIIEVDILNQKYKVKYEDKIGTINVSDVSSFEFNTDEKYSLMLDVSEFNKASNFPSEKEFELFILNHHINYVYIRLGGRGWGEKRKLVL